MVNAMTKRPALFKGIKLDKRLRAPISVPPPEFLDLLFGKRTDVVDLPAIKSEIESAIYLEQRTKLEILADNLGIGTASQDWTIRLAVRLAREIQSGFLTTEETQRKGTPGRKPTAGSYGTLWLDVLELRAEGKAKSALQACKLLSAQKGLWRGISPKKLADMVRRCDTTLRQPQEINPAWAALSLPRQKPSNIRGK